MWTRGRLRYFSEPGRALPLPWAWNVGPWYGHVHVKHFIFTQNITLLLHFLVILNFGSSQCWQINFPKLLLSSVLLFFPVFASFCFLTRLCSCISLLLNACFLCIIFFMSLVLCSLHFPWTHYVAEAGCEFLIFLHLPPDYGDYRCVPLVLVVKFKFLLSLNFFMILHAYFLLWTFLSPRSLKSL